MGRLAPAEKLPLLLRKNLRDEWESQKEKLQGELSDVLGVPWTLNDINPSAIWPYADEGYAKESLGSCLTSYVNAAINNLRRFVDRHGDEGKSEINKVCYNHSLLLDEDDRDESQRALYTAPRVLDGKLVIAFAPGRLAVNIDDVLEPDTLAKALDEAPQPEAAGNGDSADALSFAARRSIGSEYDNQIESTRARIASVLKRDDVKLVPNFEEVYAKLGEASDVRSDWQDVLGLLMRAHFEGLAGQLESQGFGSDEMLQEGLNEEMPSGEFRFRIQEELKYGTYGEVVLEDGAVYLQTPARYFGVNADSTAEKLADQL